ncbi:MAG: hypothetical protein U0746_21845 [Gemmataceae bacterium]
MKYDVEIANVREVSLVGTADLAYWADRLRPAGLHPTVADGRALLLLVAVAARFNGIPFHELSVSVFLSREVGGPGRDAGYLVHAYNSIRFFAWVERTFFRTPYYPASLEVACGPPASFRVSRGGATLLAASMASGRQPTRDGDEYWEAPIYLPGRGREADASRLFHAKLSGRTQTYPFEAGKDVLKLAPESGEPVVALLAESHFAGKEWVVRANATHGKSKTVAREMASGVT